MRLSVVLALTLVVACSGKKKDKDPEPSAHPPGVGTLVRGDAGVTAVITDIDPSGMHVDDDVAAATVQAQPQPTRAGRPIDVTLRSTPPGAQVAVDGTVIGNTPSFWNGMADGREHEFVFTMRGHAIARYRFVPITSGVIHGRLDRIEVDTDAGVPAAPPEVVPPRSPTTPSINPPSAPPTVVPDASPTTSPLPGPVPGPAAPVPSADPTNMPVGPQP
jgi:hypothetical protein